MTAHECLLIQVTSPLLCELVANSPSPRNTSLTDGTMGQSDLCFYYEWFEESTVPEAQRWSEVDDGY